MSKEQKFTLTLTGGSVSINELEVSADIAGKVVRLVMPLGNDTMPMSENRSDFVLPNGNDLPEGITAKQFMTEKQPKSDMERITCLAYYLTHNKGVASFKTIDLTHLNVEAAQPRFSNASFTARNAVGQQYLAPAGGGKKQITPRGEALVRAMPDRSAVQNALKASPMHGKKRKANAKKSKKKGT